MRRHRLLVFLAAVFAAKLVAVLQLREHALLQPDLPGFESTTYGGVAARITAGEYWLGLQSYPVPPLYVYFLALVMSVSKVLAAVRILQIVLGTAAVACVFTAARIWFGERAAWLAALLASLTGLFTFYETTILPSALDPFLTAALLAALAVALSGRRIWFAVAGIAGVLFLLNRPALIDGGLHFYIGNNAASDGTYRPIAGIAAEDLLQQRRDAREIAAASSGRTLDQSGASEYFRALGRSWIRLHPADAAVHFARKLALAFNAAHVSTSYSFPFFAYDMRTLPGVLFVGPWLLVPLGLSGLALGFFHMRRREFLVWASFVPLYAIAVALFFVTERVRLPLLVPLCIGAGAAAEFIISRGSRPVVLDAVVRRRTVVTLGALAVLAALVAVTSWPMRRDDGRAEDRTRMAEAMVVRDRIDLAEQWASRALAIHPRPADVHLRIGRRLVIHSRPEAALPHLERATLLDPASADVSYAMGLALLHARRPREAIPRLREALNGGVRQSLAGYDLARALAASGDRAGALQALQAVRPEPASDVASWNALGRLALQLESPSLAVAFFNGAVAAAPRSAAARRDLGVALTQLGRYQDAVVQLEQAAALDPADPAARLYLARVRQLMKERQ